MLHQTLVSLKPFSTTSFSSPSYPPSPSVTASRFPFAAAGRMGSPPSPLARSSQVEMKLMKDMSLSSEVEDLAWAADKGNILGEDFVVDDLLDLRGLPESAEEDGEVPRVDAEDSFSPPETFACEENEPLELYSDITLHETDAAQLEWLSRFYDDCSEFPSPSPPSLPPQKNHLFKHSSTESVVPIKAKRSKRLRGSGVVWSRSSSLKLPDSSSVSSITTFTATSPTPSSSSSSSSSSSFNSYITYEPSPSPFAFFLVDEGLPPRPKKRGRKPKNPFLSPAERRCTHCGVHKTPQWRAGPHGAKTLCNACGVRFKSGRLLPEYRPACSPTFVSDIHSNSHRKVLEMRRKKDEHLFLVPSAPPVTSC